MHRRPAQCRHVTRIRGHRHVRNRVASPAYRVEGANARATCPRHPRQSPDQGGKRMIRREQEGFFDAVAKDLFTAVLSDVLDGLGH